jgi:hypothetical protein
MPVTPLTQYPVVEDVMNRARAIINDAYQNGAGRILTDGAPFSVQFLNDALEELQDELRDYGAISLIYDNYIMSPITPVVTINPQVQVYVGFTGYFDGTTLHALPTLPGNMLAPLALEEILTDSGLPFMPMGQPQQGLCSAYQNEFLGEWEWRAGPSGDAIWMRGATTSRDLRLRYNAQLSPIAASSPTNPWTNINILVQASTRAMALLVAYAYARARGAQMAAALKMDKDKALRSIKNRYILQSQGIRRERIPYSRDSQGFRIPGIM